MSALKLFAKGVETALILAEQARELRPGAPSQVHKLDRSIQIGHGFLTGLKVMKRLEDSARKRNGRLPTARPSETDAPGAWHGFVEGEVTDEASPPMHAAHAATGEPPPLPPRPSANTAQTAHAEPLGNPFETEAEAEAHAPASATPETATPRTPPNVADFIPTLSNRDPAYRSTFSNLANDFARASLAAGMDHDAQYRAALENPVTGAIPFLNSTTVRNAFRDAAAEAAA